MPAAAPNGLGLPGYLPWSGEAVWSWCRVAAGGLVGWRVSWVRPGPPGVCSAPHQQVYAGSTTMTGRPALLAIWTSRSRKRAVGMPATARRKPLPRLPREGRFPRRSRPSARALAKSRSSMTMARVPQASTVAMRLLMAARRCPSRMVAGNPLPHRPGPRSAPCVQPPLGAPGGKVPGRRGRAEGRTGQHRGPRVHSDRGRRRASRPHRPGRRSRQGRGAATPHGLPRRHPDRAARATRRGRRTRRIPRLRPCQGHQRRRVRIDGGTLPTT